MRKIVFGLIIISLLLVGASAFAADGDLVVNGRIDANGGIKIGNVTTACSASLNGVLRYSGTALEFCDGTYWLPLINGSSADSYTKLLMHMNGTNGSIVFTDSSASIHSITANGDAQISTAQSKFGGASGYLDGNGDTLTIPASNDFNFGTGNFTIDFWIYRASTGNGDFISMTHPVLRILIENNMLKFVGGGIDAYLHSGAVPNNVWTHIAVVRNGNTITGYINGVAGDQPRTASGGIGDATNTFTIGFRDAYYNGYLDELRVSKGIARWTSNFTPPTAPY